MNSFVQTKEKETNTNMKTYIDTQLSIVRTLNTVFVGSLALILAFGFSSTRADETCSSPYLARIEGQEEFVYVWTLGVEGLGDGSDKLVTIDVKPGSPTYGKAVSTISVGGRNEAHHGGFTTTAANSGWPGSKAAGYLSSTCTVIQRNRDI
jgi:56kDa selenium binding protein (SBP56)